MTFNSRQKIIGTGGDLAYITIYTSKSLSSAQDLAYLRD